MITKKVACFKFEIGQTVEMVRGPKEIEYTANLIRRFIRNEAAVQELLALNDNRDGDLFEVKERRMKKDAKNVEHDLYLCKSLKNDEFTLFGRSGLREHVPA